MTDPLERMTVLIAGAGSGMGRATAVAAASAGARTLLLGRTLPGLEVTEAAVAAAGGAAPTVLVADAADSAALAAALAHVELGDVDVLVNSVGTNIADRAFDRLTSASWSGMIDTNLTAAFNLAKAIVPAMRARGRGLIVNVASTAARRPDMSGAAYQASKAGVLALTHAIMEEEWANGVRATAILPGMTDTPLLDRRPMPLTPEARARALQPEDVAAACLFVMRLPERAHVPELQIQPSRR
jgi:NADP-dependent 3-hydroxy acid dehydrogenase YdfG